MDYNFKLRSSNARNISGNAVRLLLEGSGAFRHPVILQQVADKFDYNYKIPPASFSYDSYLKIAEFLRQIYFGHKTDEEGYELLGYNATQAYLQGVTGQVLRMAAGVMGPQRGAKQFLKNMQGTLPWGIHELEEVKPNFMRYRIQKVPGSSGLMRGVIRASLEISGAKDIVVRSFLIATEHKLYEAQWS